MNEDSMKLKVLCHKCENPIKDVFSGKNSGRYLKCYKCGRNYFKLNNSVDLIQKKNKERSYYDNYYNTNHINKKKKVGEKYFKKKWYMNDSPGRKVLLNYLGNINNKNILLIGNGTSEKELYFLFKGANLIYTDLSLQAVNFIEQKFDFNNKNVEFYAIDANNLPFPDNSIDIIYGWAFIHHLDNIENFLNEANRVLKKNGFCIFYDNAHSKLWQKLKFTIFRPIMNYTHRKRGISPEDVIATKKGGFKEKEVKLYKEKCDFSRYKYVRFGLSYRIFRRVLNRIIGRDKSKNLKNIILPFLFKIDIKLSNISNIYYNNTINLVWIMEK